MKLPFISRSKNLDQNLSSSPPWPWPTCATIKTLSFRASDPKNTTFKTFNSVFLDTQVTPSDSFFTFSSSCRSDSTVVSDDPNDLVESVIRSLRSDRLFFDPDQSCSLVVVANGADNNEGSSGVKDKETITSCSNPICMQNLPLSLDGIEKQEGNKDANEKWDSRKCKKKGDNDEKEKDLYKQSEIMSMESSNPYEDFRRSMEEMVEAHGLKDWQGLEELLECYLKINGEQNHGLIVDAFIDLLVTHCISSNIATPMLTSSSSNATSSSSLLSSISSPSSSCPYPILDDDGDHGNDDDERR